MVYLKTALLCISVSLASATASAITNIESERLQQPESGTTGSISLTLDGSIGANDKLSLGTAVKIIRSFKHEQWITIMSRDYAEADRVVNTDESFIHLRYLQKNSKQWGHEFFVQHEEDQFSAQAKRSLIGAGLRYQLQKDKIESSDSTNHLGFGLFYEDEAYAADVTQDNEQNVRFNLYWAYKNKLADNMLYTSTLYFQPKADKFSDEKGLWQNALTISVTSTISLSLTWDVEHDSHTPNSRTDTETNYNSVLIYNF